MRQTPDPYNPVEYPLNGFRFKMRHVRLRLGGGWTFVLILSVLTWSQTQALSPNVDARDAQSDRDPSSSELITSSLLLPEVAASETCNSTFKDSQGTFTFTGEDEVCETYIEAPNNHIISMTFSGTCDIENGTIFLISDVWNDEFSTLYTYTDGEMEDVSNLQSISSRVRFYLDVSNTSEGQFEVTVSYSFISKDNITTVLYNSSGVIDTDDMERDDVINYQYTWFINAGDDNVVYFFLKNVTLNDAAGDFVAIGTGDKVFSSAPSLMISGQWTSYPTLLVNGTFAYVYLFMKNYTEEYGICIEYETSFYKPPTVIPPPTKPPADILNATIEYDDSTDYYYNVTAHFIKTVTKYAEIYCENQVSQLDVIVTEIAETKPCLEIVFFIDIVNGTCHGSIMFNATDFEYMLGNYSKGIEDDLGRPVMTSCPYNITYWVVGCVVIALISLIIVLLVGLKQRDLKYERIETVVAVPDPSTNNQDREENLYDEVPQLSYVIDQELENGEFVNEAFEGDSHYEDINQSDNQKMPVVRQQSFHFQGRLIDGRIAMENRYPDLGLPVTDWPRIIDNEYDHPTEEEYDFTETSRC